MHRVDASWTFVGLGGNLGDDEAIRARLGAARTAMEELDYVETLRASSIYRSEPIGPVAGQPEFLNQVVAFPPHEQPPVAVLADLLAIESALGRARDVPKGPRTIDLDLLLMGEQLIASNGPPRLTLPHPELTSRRFVLEPLVELVGPDLAVPGVGARIGALLRGCRRQRIWRLTPEP